ncbi:TadE/TadG family type IV pilus assembly protein [Gracilibacillus massiliensis]|uniref:TadE/TadG family type IV pilus assembly protein n=1 Tax=Gracilibacillus massiliensis TaxID=1564956 RepID=UPI00071CFB28|nr:pilus assembly protein [Gracilibacillus massiliensis]
MFLSIRKHWKKFRKNEKGMFTLEASLIFPIIFIVTISLILFSLVIYQKVVVYQKAHLIAERASFTWDNSKKEFDTGEFKETQYSSMDGGDGLYWRSNAIGTQIILKFLNTGGLSNADAAKINRAQTKGSAMYTSGSVEIEQLGMMGFDHRIKVTASSDLKLPDFVELISDDNFKATATASFKDPVELIRTTDFVVHYGKEIMEYIGN